MNVPTSPVGSLSRAASHHTTGRHNDVHAIVSRRVTGSRAPIINVLAWLPANACQALFSISISAGGAASLIAGTVRAAVGEMSIHCPRSNLCTDREVRHRV